MSTRSAFLVVAALLGAFTLSPILYAQPLVNIETVLVGDVGNANFRPVAADGGTQPVGFVPYAYRIGRYEVTIAQYATFLNTVATVTTNSKIIDLWHPGMQTNLQVAGIGRTGTGTELDPFTYFTIGNPNRPITYVSWWDAFRFSNWLHNGATTQADTESGAYRLRYFRGFPAGWEKNPEARWWLPSENEWFKAAFYKGGGTNAGYWTYATRSDLPPGNVVGTAKHANIIVTNADGNSVWSVSQTTNRVGPDPNNTVLTVAGAFPESASAYGTYDQCGNVAEWLGEFVTDNLSSSWPMTDNTHWMTRGPYWQVETAIGASHHEDESSVLGFRVAASTQAVVSVRPRIATVAKNASGFSISWDNVLMANVQRRAVLNEGTWVTVSSNNSSGVFFDSSPPLGSAFYRVIVP